MEPPWRRKSLSQGAAPGETVTYTLRLTNTGSAADTFYLSVSEVTPGWSAGGLGEWVFLESGAWATLQVRVTAPARAGYGEVGYCTVSAVGTHGGGDTSYLITSVDRGAVYLPSVIKAGGASAYPSHELLLME